MGLAGPKRPYARRLHDYEAPNLRWRQIGPHLAHHQLLLVTPGTRPSAARVRKQMRHMPNLRMYEFLDRLIAIALPRIRDFRGLSPRSFDGRGNYSLGIREQIIFPEIDYDSINQVRGLDVAITTTAATDKQARALLTGLGLPFAAAGSER